MSVPQLKQIQSSLCEQCLQLSPLRWTHPRKKKHYRTQVVRRSSIAKIWKLISGHVNVGTESQSLSENTSTLGKSQSYISRFSNFCILTVRWGVWRAGSLCGPHCNFQECWRVRFHWWGRQLAEDPVLNARGHLLTCGDTSAHISVKSAVRVQWQLEEGAQLQPWLPLHKINHKNQNLNMGHPTEGCGRTLGLW